MSSFDFNPYQQIYCLSSAANAIGSLTGTQSYLQTLAEEDIGAEIPTIHNPTIDGNTSNDSNWRLTWGPTVYKAQPDVAATGPDNVWFCAVNDSLRKCVLAVAGTAPSSILDWLQNADVASVVDFEAWSATWGNGVGTAPTTTAQQGDTRSLISSGTSWFVANILSNASPATATAPNTKVMDYLHQFQTDFPDYTIVITGHSMGGAVVPAIALGLLQSKYISTDNHAVWVMPSAGPSPGNASFNSSFSNAFPKSEGSGYQMHNVDYYNNNDVVPQAWSLNEADDRCLENLIAKIYLQADQPPKTILELIGVLGLADALLSTTNMVYSPLQGQPFTGAPIPNGIQPPSVSSRIEHVIREQHTDEYWKSIHIFDWVTQHNEKLITRLSAKAGQPKAPQVSTSTDVKKPAQVDVSPLYTV